MIYYYGRAKYLGEKCVKNEREGMNYIRFAAKKGHQSAKDLYEIYKKDINQIPNSKSSSVESLNELGFTDAKYNFSEQKTTEITHLKDDSYFLQKDFDIEKIVNDVQNNYNNIDIIQFDNDELAKINFILTDGASKRLTELYNYINAGVPVLLEGPTGTSKTLSSEIVCKLLDSPEHPINLIRFNLSSETKSSDLLGRYVGDSDSWAGIKMLPGPFITAFENGYTLLLDEINLASPECLQFIEETLDSKVISVELPSMPLREIKMHPNFRLIATQNPNKGLFAHKRQDLGRKFLSRFQVINFPAFTEDELLQIARGLANGFNFGGDNQIIEDLVKFHMSWSENPIISDDIQCFTIREIAATVKALSSNENIYDTIMTIYGARYSKEKKDILENEFRKYQSFRDCSPTIFDYPDSFPQCYHNSSLSNALKSIIFSFSNNRHVILTASEGTGITQVARWVSQWYTNKFDNDSKLLLKNKEYFCVCTEETKCSDLIGRHKASEKINSNSFDNELIEWKSGFLTEAIENGYCAVLDSLDEAPSTVTERLNGLLDKKYDGKEKMFEIPENPKRREVPIHENFRLLCTCKIDNINQMSPAFINRFDVIVLENQICSDEAELKSLISILMEQAPIQISNYHNQEIVDDDFNDGWDEDEEESTHEKSKSEHKNDADSNTTFKPSQEMIDQIYNNIDPTNITMLQLSQLCKAITKYYQYFPKDEISFESIIEFSKNMLNRNADFMVPANIESYLLSKLKSQTITDDNIFFFQKSPPLKNFIAKLFAASLINLHVCVYGPTGAGKTSAAREFARIRPLQSRLKESFQMHSFHAGTKPKHFYGTTTIKNGHIFFINGTLTSAMNRGCTFIADEMNLSPESIMKSLAPALEPCIGQYTNISGIEEPICIHPEFFFIACQNDLGTIGRNAIPSSIASRFRYFNYPNQNADDIASICTDISESFYKTDEVPSFSKEDSHRVGQYMTNLNKLKLKIIPPWSLRDVTKLFLRIHYQDTHSESFRNMTLCHNLLFYTMSSVYTEDYDDIFEKVWELIGDTFSLPGDKRNELRNCFYEQPKINKIDSHVFLIKGTCGISFDSFNNIGIGLPSLLNAIFQVSLSVQSEPILLMGPSGFKTFLSKQFNPGAKVIPVNQESTISQLLGSSSFLTKKEAKLFYLDNICKICRVSNDFPSLKAKLDNETLTKDDVERSIRPNFAIIPSSFKNAVNLLLNKLDDDDDQKNSNNCILSNMKLEFKPGLILSAILQGKSLILKNLSNLPTIVLERFNELFSGKHNLTLNEDIHNTFTDDDKEITGISSSFRVFATCPPNSATILSEAVLSRFTVICVSQYENTEENNEQKTVLESYIDYNKLNFDKYFISYIIKFAEKMNLHLKKNFSFPQIINAIEICSRLNDNSKPSEYLTNLGVIIYRLASGLLEKRTKVKDIFHTIFDELNIPISLELKNSIYENPFTQESQNGFSGVSSKISKLFIQSPEIKNVDAKIAFTPMFSEMLDILHLGLFANIPVIFEGIPGQGKQTAINYISEMLGYNVINIIISKSTKVEDLLGKTTIKRDESNNINVTIIETKLVKVLRSEFDYSKSLVVFHNINNASSAVLEILESIFDQHQKDIPLPDGSTIQKGKINLVGIINPQSGFFNRDKLPSSLIFSSIYHIVNNPKKLDILSIISKLFEDTPFKLDVKTLYDKYMITKNYALEVNSPPVSLSDIMKYKIFREATFGKIDETLISLMIFAYRFMHQENIKELAEKIGQTDMSFNPIFNYNIEKHELYIQISEQSKTGITLQLQSDFNAELIQSIQSRIGCLSLPQKHCLIFLAISVLSKRSCILQGDTASGKSHIIRLFADMLGKKLNIYQMNSDTGLSILTGQSVLYNRITKEDIDDFSVALADLKTIPELREHILEKFAIPPSEWSPPLFYDLLQYIMVFLEVKQDISKDELDIILSAKQKIAETIQPAKRFHHEESSFIRAMENGEWVLIDGMESAPPEITEKISSLCGDNPELDLNECGENYYFTRKVQKKSKLINDGFQLFVTYNSTSTAENKTLDPIFLNKCTSFTLPPIDSNPEYSAQIMLGSLIQNYPKDFSIQISSRMASAHSYAKKESQDDKDSFAGELQYTGRTLKFIMNEFLNHSKENDFNPMENGYKPVCNSLQQYYWNSYINDSKRKIFQQKMVDHFSNKPDEKLINSLNYEGINLKDKNKNLLIYLRNIQLYASGSIQSSNFNFFDFVDKCRIVQITDVPFIYLQIQDTIDLIDKSNYDQIYKTTIIDQEYPQLKIIERILKDIMDGMKTLKAENTNLHLSDDDLLKTSKLDQPVSRLTLLYKLLQDNSTYISSCIPGLLFNEDFTSLMKIIFDMVLDEKLDLYKFSNFIFLLHDNPSIIPIIEPRIPYNLFKNTPFELIYYWMPLIKDLHESSISFHIIVLDKTYDFIYNQQSEFEPTYIFKEENGLILSPLSVIVFHSKPNGPKIPSYKIPESIKNKPTDLRKRSSLFYGLTDYLIKNPRNITKESISRQFSRFQNEIPNPRENQVAKYSVLLTERNLFNPSLVAKAWSIVYTFPSNIIELLCNYLHPLESETFRSFFMIYNAIDKTNIDLIFNFTKWMLHFGSEQSYLWRISNRSFKIDKFINVNDAKKILKEIEMEINNIKSVPVFNKQIWQPDPYITLLENSKQPIDEIILDFNKNDEEFKLRSELNKIIAKLQEIKVTKREHILLKEQIINQISKDSEINPTKEKLDLYKLQEQKFRDYVTKIDAEYIQNNILWPNYNPTKFLGNVPSKNMRLYSHVIWFSKINNIFSKIIKRGNKDIFQDVLQLSNFPEMQSTVQYLTNSLLKVGRSGLDPENIDIMYSSLNAHFIAKLIDDELYNDIDKLDEIFNDLQQRNSLDNERDLEWIHKIANHFPPDFKLSLPQFRAKDLLFLFIEYRGDNYDPVLGPLILKYNYNDILNSLKRQIWIEFENPIQCSTSIAKIAYRKIYDVENKNPSPTDSKSFEKLLNEKPPQNIIDKKIIEIVIKVMLIAEKINHIPQFKFTFNDTEFLKNDWIHNDNFINSYPSLIYWLCKNNRCAKQLQNIFEGSEFDENHLPFWLFSLRLMSTDDCITFDSSVMSSSTKFISETIETTVRPLIREKVLNKQTIGTKWLNILLSYIPPELSIQEYRMFYQFFLNLSDDNMKLADIIFKEKSEGIQNFISNICTMVFDEGIESIMTSSFSKDDSNLKFIIDPNKYINNKIYNSITKLCNDFINSKHFIQLKNESKILFDQINEDIKKLKNLISTETKEKQRKYEEERNRKNNDDFEMLKNDIISLINKYNTEFEKLSNPYILDKDLQESCSTIIKLKNKMPNFYDYKSTPISFYQFCCKNQDFDNFRYILYYKNNEFNIEKKPMKYNQPYYFKTSKIIKNSVEIHPTFGSIQNGSNYLSELFFYPFDKSFNINNYCLKKLTNSATEIKPALIFGKNMSHQAFTELLCQTNRNINQLLNDFFDEFSNMKINDRTLNIPTDILSNIENLLKSLFVKFSDNEKCPNIDACLEKIMNRIVQIQLLVVPINQQLKDKIENPWKASYNRNNSVFNNKYELPIPSNNSISCSHLLFRNMMSTVSSSPILKINNGSIACSSKRLIRNIGPIIPSLYSRNIKMNFISFIDQDLSLTIETDKKYKELFSYKQTFSKDDIVQVFISISSLAPESVETIRISTIFHFTSSSLKELNLPCDFIITVAPLSILLTCKKYPLTFKDDNFYLCAEKIFASSKLIFTIQNYYLKDNSCFIYQLTSFDDNTIAKPKEKVKENEIELQIDSKDNKVKRLHCALKLKFSDSFSTSIIIDAAIIPFEFAFDMYDPNLKKFISNNETLTVYYTKDFLFNDIVLHCRIYSPSFVCQLAGQLVDDLPKGINIEIKNLTQFFNINQNTDFDIILKINGSIQLSYNSLFYGVVHGNQKKYHIAININGIQQIIYLNFKEINKYSTNNMNYYDQEFLQKFTLYYYDNFQLKWYPVFKQFDVVNKYLVVTPFSYSFPYHEYIIYHDTYCEIKNTYDNFFFYINSNGSKDFSKAYSSTGIFDFLKSKNTWNTLMSSDDDNTLYPIFGQSNSKWWYPVYQQYPKLNWDELDIYDEANISKALEDIYKDRRNAYSNTDYFRFYNLLIHSKVVKQIAYFIDSLPFKSQFESINNAAKIMDENDPRMIILSHNAILKFCVLFESRYNEIKENNWELAQLPVSKEVIQSKKQECHNKYYNIDSNAINHDNLSNTKRYFKKIEDEIKTFDLQPMPPEEEQNAQYLFTENSIPIPKLCIETPKYIVQPGVQDDVYAEDDVFQIELPDIKIPNKSEIQLLTISELDNIYLSCLQGTRILPIYVQNMKKLKNTNMEKKAVEYFGKLLQLYKDLPTHDYSFISSSTNSFSKSFTSMIARFKKSGVNFQKLLPNKCLITDEVIQEDFFQFPDKDKISLPPEDWSTNEKIYLTDFENGPSLSYGRFDLDKSQNIKISNPLYIPLEKNESESGLLLTEEESKDQHESEDQDIEFKKTVLDIENQLKNEPDDDVDDTENGFFDGENAKNQVNQENKAFLLSNNSKSKSIEINSAKFDENISKFTEQSGIERAISRMKDMDKNSVLNISYTPPHSLKNNYSEPEINKFPIVKLMQQASYLAHKFIIAASHVDIPLSSIAVNILIDCSSYISNENKIFNMMIICALTQALTSLEIPYSAAVVADQNFKCILKTFDHPHSQKCLQKICDCLLIKRYRTKLACSTKFAIDSMRYTIDNSKQNRAIFTFSDGLDEQLILTKAWSEIVSNDKLSFGYIFIKSIHLTGENLKFVENVWTNFEKEIMQNNPKSNVKVASIQAEISNELTEKLEQLFANVMKRDNEIEVKQIEKKYEKPEFSIDETYSNISRLSNYMKADYQSLKGVFIGTTQILKKANLSMDKLDPKEYRNKLKNIACCNADENTKKDHSIFIKDFLINRRKIDNSSIEVAFPPNKASQTVLSTTGTDFEITALVLYLINPVPDPMIYLEEKGGLIRNYGVSIVIDRSNSCFDEISGPHSFQTIRTILSTLASLDLPCFDLIVAGNPNPIVICSEIDTLSALNEKSPLYESLFALLQTPVLHADLSSAIRVAYDLRRMRSAEYTNLLFVLTDGLYEKSERKSIIEMVNNCVQSGITTFGIGIGIYPKGIEQLFPQVVFSPNPSNLMKSIASIYGYNIPSILSEMIPIIIPEPSHTELIQVIAEMIANEKTPSFASLKKELHDIAPALDAFDDMYNEEKDIGNKSDGFVNPTGPRTEIYVKDLLKTQKILIVMLWDNTLNPDEESFINPAFIDKPSQKDAGCIKTAVEHFGITLKTVQNYEDAINELTKQSRPGFCDYYAVWVFCGPPYAVLPEQDADPNLVGQFNEVLIQFWKNGGSIVFWADGCPLYYQVNLFLETVTFENEPDCPIGKTQLKISDEHEGDKILYPDNSDNLSNIKTFNRSPQFFKQCQRTTLSHNLGKIYEGITISCAPYDLSLIKPFKPFARDSEGGIISLFYSANLMTGTGDIVIDCGYTKCFTKMATDGTFRYVQNIAGWTARPEVHQRIDGIQPCDWRPKAVEYTIIKGVKWNHFDPFPEQFVPIDPHTLRNLWAIDCSGSVKDAKLYHEELKKIIDEYYKNGDDIWLWSNESKHVNYEELQIFNNRKLGKGGTESSLIAQIAQSSDCRDHLIIVTDGDVNTGAIDRSDEIMKNSDIKFKYVTTFIIGTGSLSVGAPYSRGCQNVTYSVKSPDDRTIAVTLSNEDIAALNNIANINIGCYDINKNFSE